MTRTFTCGEAVNATFMQSSRGGQIDSNIDTNSGIDVGQILA